MTEPDDALRVDKWLWQARFFKSRGLAAKLCAGGKMRINRQPVSKSHQRVRVGDVLTFPQGKLVRVVRIAALGTRRGPAMEARALYEDLNPPPEGSPSPDET
ncbi:MAG: RNA-binding protein [Rhodospirillaceae bacterium]|nr:RNA-binding protein [Rhodospirillaceae bacterium]